MPDRFIYVTCNVSRGAFSSERVFTIEQSDGAKYVGIAPLHYYRKNDGKSFFTKSEPLLGESVSGKIAARKVDVKGNDVRILVPDGESVYVSGGMITVRDPGNVPVG